MYIECTNNNAVVRTFIALLQESTDRSQTSSASLVETLEDSDEGTQNTVNIQDRGRVNRDFQESVGSYYDCPIVCFLVQILPSNEDIPSTWTIGYVPWVSGIDVRATLYVLQCKKFQTYNYVECIILLLLYDLYF